MKSRKVDEDDFVPNARLAGATPMWEWLGAAPALSLRPIASIREAAMSFRRPGGLEVRYRLREADPAG